MHTLRRASRSEIDNKLTNKRQHNKYLLQYIGYMFGPVYRSSSGLHRNKSQVLFRCWDPNIFYNCERTENQILDKM